MKNYIEQIAEEIRLAVPASDLPDDDTGDLFRYYAVILLGRGITASAEDVHNAWSAWMSGRDAEHESIVPFSSLPPDVAAQDEPFVEAIRAVARARSAN